MKEELAIITFDDDIREEQTMTDKQIDNIIEICKQNIFGYYDVFEKYCAKQQIKEYLFSQESETEKEMIRRLLDNNYNKNISIRIGRNEIFKPIDPRLFAVKTHHTVVYYGPDFDKAYELFSKEG